MKLLLAVTFLLYSLPSVAGGYYFSASEGDDNRSFAEASNPATPWKSISKLNLIIPVLLPGDSVFFKSGDIFNGQIKVLRSGEVGREIVFTSYGTGEHPKISGFRQAPGWKNSGNNLWVAEFPALGFIDLVIIDGVIAPVGRYPNFNNIDGGFLRIDSATVENTIFSEKLENTISWKGGDAVIRKNRWIIDRERIVDHQGNRIKHSLINDYKPQKNFGFFIQNHISTLDQQNEWFFDNEAKKLFIFSYANPSAFDIQAASEDVLLEIVNSKHVKFQNISFEGTNHAFIKLYNCSFIEISNCEFIFSAKKAIIIHSCSNLKIDNSAISHINDVGIEADHASENISILDNTINNIGMIAGSGGSGDDTYQAIITRAANVDIANNRIDNVGYCAIRFEGSNIFIRNNFITNFLQIKDDGGAIYTWKSRNDSVAQKNRKVESNIILYGKGQTFGAGEESEVVAAGIYLDDNAENVEITRNSVAYCQYAGLFVHNAQNLNIQGNKFFDNGFQQVSLRHDDIASEKPIRNLIFKNNVLFCNSPDQLTLKVSTIKDDVAGFGIFEKNYFVHPYKSDLYIEVDLIRDAKLIYHHIGLEQWKELFSHDLESKKTSIDLSPTYTSFNEGVNKIRNGRYSTGLGDQYCFSPSGDCNIKWSKISPLDEGAMEISIAKPNERKKILVTVKIGKVAANRTYKVKFSMVGSETIVPLQAFLREMDEPYTEISNRQNARIRKNREDYTLYLQAFQAQKEAFFVLEILDPSGNIWIDNLEVKECEVMVSFPENKISFEYNPATTVKSVLLHKHAVDSHGNFSTGVLKLAPFESEILTEKAMSSLPVENLRLYRYTKSSEFQLRWTYTLSTSINYFEVLKSVDGLSFIPIAKIDHLPEANGVINGATNSFTFGAGLNSTGYFMIKAVGAYGEIVYSNIVVGESKENIKLSFFPNPARTFVNIKSPVLNSRVTVLNIINSTGKVVKTIKSNAGEQINSINISDFNSGTYFVRISDDSKEYLGSFIKL